jgi:hypothetical protein
MKTISKAISEALSEVDVDAKIWEEVFDAEHSGDIEWADELRKIWSLPSSMLMDAGYAYHKANLLALKLQKLLDMAEELEDKGILRP